MREYAIMILTYDDRISVTTVTNETCWDMDTMDLHGKNAGVQDVNAKIHISPENVQ